MLTDKRIKPRRAARYVRVSTWDQRPGLQADETAELIARRGWVLADTFAEHSVSGGKEHRPELDRLMGAARRGAFDVLVVWKADRLFRSLKHMVTALDELASLGIDFVSVTEPFDTSTPQGRLLLHLISVFAEFERRVLIERTKSGMAAARRRGAKIGRPRAAVDLAAALTLRDAGKSLNYIARELKVSKATIFRALAASSAAGPEGSGPQHP